MKLTKDGSVKDVSNEKLVDILKDAGWNEAKKPAKKTTKKKD
jgi:hypothetical protein